MSSIGFERFLSSAAILAFCSVGGAYAADYAPPAASQALLAGIDFTAAAPVNEDYRAQFKECDDHNQFRGNALTGWRKCSGDKNNVRALLKLADGSIYFESKQGLDLDGSWLAWHDPGAADLKGTWYQWPRICSDDERDGDGACQREQVDAEHIPFIVIPTAGPSAFKKEFRDKTGVDKGDFGVIIYGDKWVPAFVADGGPYNKLGEGSAAALAGIGEDRCRNHNAEGFCDRYKDTSVESGVVTIIFPGSRRPGMTADQVIGFMCEEAKTRLGMQGSPLCD